MVFSQLKTIKAEIFFKKVLCYRLVCTIAHTLELAADSNRKEESNVCVCVHEGRGGDGRRVLLTQASPEAFQDKRKTGTRKKKGI